MASNMPKYTRNTSAPAQIKMLLGQYQAKLGLKSRTSIPSKFRSELGKDIVIAKWYESCLVVVPKRKLENFLNRLTGRKDSITTPIRDTDRFILGSAYEIELDNQGRFVIPRALREYANLRENLIILGLGDRAEIWDEANWRKHEQALSQNAPQMLDFLTYERQATNL